MGAMSEAVRQGELQDDDEEDSGDNIAEDGGNADDEVKVFDSSVLVDTDGNSEDINNVMAVTDVGDNEEASSTPGEASGGGSSKESSQPTSLCLWLKCIVHKIIYWQYHVL